MAQPDIYSRTMIDVLTPSIKSAVALQYIADTFAGAGCTHKDGFANEHIEHYPMERYSIFKATTGLGTFNHQQLITKWQGKYWCVWDNGLVHEDVPGQSTFIAFSEDGKTWSPRHLVVAGDTEKGVLHIVGSLYPTRDRLYAIIQRTWQVSPALMQGMSAIDIRRSCHRLDLWSTTNGTDWQICREGCVDAMILYENPRLTADGRLLVAVTTHQMHPGVALWPADDPEATPEIIPLPYHGNTEDFFIGHDEGLFLYGEASWYADPDGRIWLWHRDESAPGYLGVAQSRDGGQSWTEVMHSNFPNAMSRVHAGRLNDGRYYLVGNATRRFMDRNFFALALSDDGAKFNRLIRLIEEPTRQRFQGHLKVHGYQYPSCLVEGDKLMIVYSVNKEDIELGIVDMKQL